MRTANAFFGAYQDKSDDELKKAAVALSADREALLEVMARTSKLSPYIEQVFKHFGLPLTGSKP